MEWFIKLQNYEKTRWSTTRIHFHCNSHQAIHDKRVAFIDSSFKTVFLFDAKKEGVRETKAIREERKSTPAGFSER
jgi:hypothetical protein